MRINQVQNYSDSNGQESQVYRVEMNSVLASILSDKMYSNKQAALWREPYANAHDATPRNSKGELLDESYRPIVKLPTRDDMTCYVQDFGTGMSKADLLHYHTTFGASTKRSSNASIGGYGIGSKVGFCYTDTYEIESWHCVADSLRSVSADIVTSNGISPNLVVVDSLRNVSGRYVHMVCHKDQSGMPTVTIVQDRPMQEGERTGLKYSWTCLTSADQARFVQEAYRTLKNFPIQPTYKPDTLKPEPIEKVSSGTWWYVENYGASYPRGFNAIVMGGVTYPLVSSSLVVNQVTLEAPIGYLQVTASREGLSNDPVTEKRVEALVSKFNDEYLHSVKGQLSLLPLLPRLKLSLSLPSRVRDHLKKQGIDCSINHLDALNIYTLSRKTGWGSLKPFPKNPRRVKLHCEYEGNALSLYDSKVFFLPETTKFKGSVNKALTSYATAKGIDTIYLTECEAGIPLLKASGFLSDDHTGASHTGNLIVWTEELQEEYRPSSTTTRTRTTYSVPSVVRISYAPSCTSASDPIWSISNGDNPDRFDERFPASKDDPVFYHDSAFKGISPDNNLYGLLRRLDMMHLSSILTMSVTEARKVKDKANWYDLALDSSQALLQKKVESILEPTALKQRAFDYLLATKLRGALTISHRFEGYRGKATTLLAAYFNHKDNDMKAIKGLTDKDQQDVGNRVNATCDALVSAFKKNYPMAFTLFSYLGGYPSRLSDFGAAAVLDYMKERDASDPKA